MTTNWMFNILVKMSMISFSFPCLVPLAPLYTNRFKIVAQCHFSPFSQLPTGISIISMSFPHGFNKKDCLSFLRNYQPLIFALVHFKCLQDCTMNDKLLCLGRILIQYLWTLIYSHYSLLLIFVLDKSIFSSFP